MEKTTAYRDKEIFYQAHGKGKAVVLIHGFAEDGTIWDDHVNRLQNNFRLIIPDIPGSGRSSLISPAPTIEDYADCIRAIMHTEKITDCVMIGHSMGGYITLAFAERYPDLLKGIGFFHSTAYADSEEKKDTRRKSIAFIRQYGAAPFIEQFTPNLFSENFKKKNPHIVSVLAQRYINFDPVSLISYHEAMLQRPDRTHILKTFPNPVLFIIGEQDKAIPLQESLLQSHIPQLSFIHILENTAHMGMMEDIHESTISVESFLKQIVNF